MPIKPFFIIFFLTVILRKTHSLTINDFEIRDLEATTSYLTTEAQSWQITNQIGVGNTTECQGSWMLGGYGITGAGTVFSRDYESLPNHKLIHFSITFWLIDLEETTSLFEIYFDNQLVGQWDSNNYDFTTLGTTDICGGNQADYASIVITGQVAHSAQSLAFKVASLFTAGTNSFSFGFKNLNLLFYDSNSATSVCQFVDTSDSEASCFCPSGEFDKAGGASCRSCNAACSSCLSANAKQCASCAPGYSFNGDKCVQCSSSGACAQCTSDEFLYWNSTCLASCNSPLVQNIQGIYKYCEMPCNSSQYLYQNNTCGSVCPSPLVSSQDGVVKLCDFPCDNGSFYSSWNLTCIASCESPLVQRIQGTDSYCDLPCDSSEYLYEDDSCGLDCPSPLVSSQEGDVKLCNFPCDSSSFYYSWNSTCITSCDPPLIQNIQGTERFCELPCDSSEYLYEDDSCGLDCLSPLVSSQEGDVKLCNFPCHNDSFYYSWNLTCITSCDSPLVQSIQGTYKYCDLPCDSSEFLYEEDNTCHSACPTSMESSQNGQVKLCSLPCDSGSFYSSWNSSCIASCGSPLIQSIQGDYQYCELPCNSNEYLYQDDTCHSNCPTPMVSSQENDVKLCNSPCSSGLFYYENSTCHNSCPAPYTSVNTSYLSSCNKPCPHSQYYNQDHNECLTSCDSPNLIQDEQGVQICVLSDFMVNPVTQAIGSVASSLSSVANVLRPSGTNSVFMTALAKLVKYVKYMNVSLPDQVRQAFESSNSSSFSISTTLSYSMPQSLGGSLQHHPLPAIFERTELNSSYLMNQWSSFSTFSLVIILGITFYVLDIYGHRFSKSTRLASFSKRMRVLTEWNLLLYFIFNIYDDFTLFTILEFKTLHLDSFGSYLSFFACIGVSLFALFLLGVTLYIPHQRRKTSEDVPFYLKWENLQVLYAGYDTKSWFQRNFLFISTCRIVITYILVGCFYSYPMLQTPIFTTTSLLIVFILIKLRPIKDWMNWVFALGFEGLMLVVNICLLILAIADCYTEGMTSFKKSVGQVILVTNTLVDIFSTLYIPGCLIGCAYYCHNVYKKSGKTKRIVWLNMLICIYSNPGMDFDDLSNDIDRNSEKNQKKKFIGKITPIVIAPCIEEKSFIQSPLSQSSEKLFNKGISVPGSPSSYLMVSASPTINETKISVNGNNSQIPQSVDENCGDIFTGLKLDETHSICHNKFEDSFLGPSTIREPESVEIRGTSILVEDSLERRKKPRAKTQKMTTNGLKGFSTSVHSRQSVFGKVTSMRDELSNENPNRDEDKEPRLIRAKKQRNSHSSSWLWVSSFKRASFLDSNRNIPTLFESKILLDIEAVAGFSNENNNGKIDSISEDFGTVDCLKEENVEKSKPVILINNLVTASSIRKVSDSPSHESNEVESI